MLPCRGVARRGAARGLTVLGVASILHAACAPRELAPLPEVVVIADTDLPVPLFSRLRVDLYAEDGTWFDSRDYVRPDRRDWPTSFGIYADEDGRERVVWVRLRIYPEGATFPYRGERFRRWDNPFASADKGSGPRLVRGDRDVTPALYPSPLTSVDRLVAVRVGPAHTGRTHVVLHGACATTMAHLGPEGRPSFATSESCVDTEKTWSAVEEAPLLSRDTPLPETRVGTWLASEPCEAGRDEAPRICIPGGATLLGSNGDTGQVLDPDGSAAPTVVRLFGIHSFAIDRDEVTVARFRAARARGFDGQTAEVGARCTFTASPGVHEAYPVSCVDWDTARAFCKFEGGDLPTELQWEHAASVAGFREKTPFPWGVDAPRCEDAVLQRDDARRETSACKSLGLGPAPIGTGARDVTPLGVRDLLGGLIEWTRDGWASYHSLRWGTAPIVDPTTDPSSQKTRVTRGNSWQTSALITSERYEVDPSAAQVAIGFRCAYPREP